MFEKVVFPKYDSNPRYLKNTCVDVIFVSWIWSFFRFSVSSIVYLFTSRSTSQKSHISFIKFDISLWRTTGMLTIMTQCQFPPTLVHIWVWTKLTACSPKPHGCSKLDPKSFWLQHFHDGSFQKSGRFPSSFFGEKCLKSTLGIKGKTLVVDLPNTLK